MSSDAAILEEIARLSNAIQQAKAGHPPAPQYPSHSFPARGRGTRGRGGRGRGRGGYVNNYSALPVTLHRNAKWVAPKAGESQANTSTTKTTINSIPSTSTSTTMNMSSTPESLVTDTNASTSNYNAVASSSKPILASRGGFKNRSLVLRSGGVPLEVPTTTTPSADNKEVIIDGVVFVSDPTGNKLVRKLGGSTKEGSSTSDSSTPKRASISGTTYIRTKTGNLISLDFAKKRRDANEKKELVAKKDRLDRLVGIVKDVQGARDGDEVNNRGRGGRGRARGRGRGRGGRGRGGSNAFVRPIPKRLAKLCRFFQKTGQCNNGLTCPYTHDSNKVAICPLSLRNKCPNKSTTCSLSHSPNPNRSPHCTHFPNCNKGISCPYTHSHVSRESGVCDGFAKMGWCEKGLECTLRHAFECPEFSEKGLCSTLGCKLPHILRRRNEAGLEEESDVGEDEDEDELKEGEIDWDAGGVGEVNSGKRRMIDDDEGTTEGILSVKRRKKQVKEDLANNSDFVTLVVPLSDEEDGEFYDEDDIEEDDDQEDEEEEEEEVATDEEGDEEVAASAVVLDFAGEEEEEEEVEPQYIIDDDGIATGSLYSRGDREY